MQKNHYHALQSFMKMSVVLFALLLVVTSCERDAENVWRGRNQPLKGMASEMPTIVDIAVSNPNFTILTAAVVKTGLAPVLSKRDLEFTVFAPTDAAFAKLPAPFNSAASINAISDTAQLSALKSILLYHVSSGKKTASQLQPADLPTEKAKPNNKLFISKTRGNVFINGNSKVVIADVIAANGVIHAIDNVLLFPTQNIVEIAIANSNFSALVAAVVKTGLAGALSSDGHFTVFAPTDAAFAKLPAPFNNAANISGISDPAQISFLKTVLLYHVNGTNRFFSTDLREGQFFTTLAPIYFNSARISLAGGAKVKGDGNLTASNIVTVNILATNGVIHVIDQVLIPRL
jgi:uncharacterized surface protein with fasciclin (FAS1) repeats